MSESRTFFCETVEQIVADTLTQRDIEGAERAVLPAKLYDALSANGVTSMLVPEDRGGIGADIGDAVAILRTMGAAAVPGPILETMLGNAVLAEAGLDPVDGTLALAFAADGDKQLHDVPWVTTAQHLLVVTRQGVRLLQQPEVRDEVPDTSGEPRATVDLSDKGAWRDFDTSHLLAQASILRCGQMLGAVEWTLTRSIEYAGERKQFGREIAKFQVIQQMLAELADHVLASAGITEAAAEQPTVALVAAARSRVADAADCAIATGHQVHGALGFSMEYALNYRTRRLMAWRDDYGSTQFWRRCLAEQFIGGSRDDLWPRIVTAS